MLMFDRITLDSPRRCEDGSLVAMARVARTGVQTYRGYEVGKPEMPVVRVYRPEAEVFNRDSMASFAHVPLTHRHPPEAVTADNWSKYAVGDVGEEIVRDGDAIRVPMIVRDAAAVKAIDAGTRELSAGYECELVWGDGAAPDGTPYDAVQTAIRANHVAIVDHARGGSSLRIGDSPMPKTIMYDGLPIVVADDASEAVINKALTALNDAQVKLGTLTAEAVTHKATLDAKDGEIAALNAKLADAQVTPEKLQQMADARAKVITDAKTIKPDIIGDGKTDAQIMREAVAHRLSDEAVKEMSDAAVSGAFLALARDGSGGGVKPDPARLASAMPINIGDARAKAQAAYEARNKELAEGYKAKA